MNNLDEIFKRLDKSSFRSKFRLKESEFTSIQKYGLDKIKEHAYSFIRTRLSPAIIPNDGKQTPMRNHPVFVAQHATATCCRGCIEKWYKIPKGVQLNEIQIDFLVSVIMEWIQRQLNHNYQSN